MSQPAKTIAFKLSGLVIYGLAMGCGSFLMFCVEPFVAQLLLPALGGGPNVWTSCMLFFQAILLAGYIYAHMITRFSIQTQVLLQLAVVWLPVGCLPVQRPLPPPAEAHPYLWAFLSLATMVGSLFFSISTTAPLLQKWYSKIDAAGSADPYFLYAMSNLGGLLGLVSYSLWVSPNLGLIDQSKSLSMLYVSFAILITTCGVFFGFGKKRVEPAARLVESEQEKTAVPSQHTSELNTEERETRNIEEANVETQKPSVSLDSAKDKLEQSEDTPIPLRKVLYWLLMSAIPSSLVLGLTSYVTSEILSIPLFWTVPLFLYLLSFIIAFSRCPVSILKLFQLSAPLVVAFVVVLLTSPTLSSAVYGTTATVTAGLSINLLALFLVCVAFHGQIAIDRPSSNHITAYYLIISIGGLLGSCFNTLLAPLLFKGAEEYPLVLLMAAVILSGLPRIAIPLLAKLQDRFLKPGFERQSELSTLLVPAVVFAVSAVLWFLNGNGSESRNLQSISAGGRALAAVTVLEFCCHLLLPYLICVCLSRNLTQFRLGLAVICGFFFYSYALADPLIVFRDRNFFGFVSVRINKTYNCCEIWNGLSLHGLESLDPAKRGRPFLYMSPTGPVGQILQSLFPDTPVTPVDAAENSRRNSEIETASAGNAPGPIGIIGVGCGTAAYLAKPHQTIIFYEINPQVIQIADNPFYFSYFYLARKRGVDLRLVCGDGRLEIQKAPYNFFKLIISDAYSGAAIPTHLITLEAIKTYLQKLTPDGVLVFNINNEYYNLWPVFASVAPELGAKAILVREYYLDEGCDDTTYTEWVFITRNEKAIELLKREVEKNKLHNQQQQPQPDSKFRLWTDDFSNPLILINPNAFS